MSQKFDLEKSLKVTDNDYELLREIIQLFNSERVTMVEEIDRALHNQDLNLIKRSAHSLKGTLANIGAEICTEYANKIEHTDSLENIPASIELFNKLKIEIEDYFVEVKEKLSSINI